MGTESDNGHVGYIYVNGGRVGEVRYTLTEAQKFGMAMEKYVDASNEALIAFPIVTGFLGAAGGTAAYFFGEVAGSVLTTLGSVASEQVGVFTTKAAARLAIQSLRLNAVQAAAVLSTIARATASSTIEVFKSGHDIVVRISRSGWDGYQAMSTVVDKAGTKQVVQKAFNAAGRLVEYDIKK